MKFLFLFLFSIISYSQKIIVVDSLSKENLPFANITLKKDNDEILKDYLNENGTYLIDKNKSFTHISISNLGYNPKEIMRNRVKDTIFLVPKINLIEEVLVTKNIKNNFSIVGLVNERKHQEFDLGKGVEKVIFIKNEFNIEKRIKSILLKIKKTGKGKIAFRIHLYENNNMIPGNNLLDENIISYLDEKKMSITEIDISDLSLIFPKEGVFVGIENVGIIDADFNNKIRVEYNQSLNSQITFIRNTLKKEQWNDINEEFKKLNILKYKNKLNANFAIKVY